MSPGRGGREMGGFQPIEDLQYATMSDYNHGLPQMASS